MKNTKNSKKNFQKNSDGMTLIEILMAMAIFIFIIGGITLFSVRAIESHTKSQAMQNSLENARFAIEDLSKKIRSSNSLDGGSDQVFFIDNVSDNSFCYQFSGDPEYKLEIAEGDGSESSCSELSGFEPIVGESGNGSDVQVDGHFEIKDGSAGQPMVRTVIELSYKEGSAMPSEKDTKRIQSTVSLRNY